MFFIEIYNTIGRKIKRNENQLIIKNNKIINGIYNNYIYINIQFIKQKKTPKKESLTTNLTKS